MSVRNEAWREALRREMKNKERMDVPRVRMNELAPDFRSHNNEEVNAGLTEAQALTEAKRCLDCPNPSCVEGCPVSVDIPLFIKNIERGAFTEAAKALRQTSSLPAVCGRVCPQEKQCESLCIRVKMKSESVAIGYLERFAADWEQQNGNTDGQPAVIRKNIKVAVAGSGPAGLSFAGDMAKAGYDVTVFEALHEIGGVLKYGIPEFRLPNRTVDIEIDVLRRMGVAFVTNCVIGKTITCEDLREAGYSGIFVASGAGLPNFMNIPGENLAGVMSANEYLTRVNLMDAASDGSDTPVLKGRNVAVIGGGNTAMDAVRTARRLGAARALIVYRRSEAEMPARAEEIRHAREEGVEFLTLHSPIAYTGDATGRVASMQLQQMRLSEPDSSGRRRPEAVEGAVSAVEVDEVIVSVGVSPNPLISSTFSGLDVSPKGTVVIEEATMQTSLPDVYAGGDIVRGGATVILAMGDGRRAAAAMQQKLMQNRP